MGNAGKTKKRIGNISAEGRHFAAVTAERTRHDKSEESGISWWQLSLIGVGSIIGAGFFLGTGLSIRMSGPGVLILYVIGGLIAFLLFLALAEMTVRDPEPGSFRVYAHKALGPRAGFMSGWMYWTAGVLIMSSEDTALSIFTRYWFPGFPMWVFAAAYALAGLLIVMLGVSNFGKVESLFGILKISTLVVFIGFALFFLIRVLLGFGMPAGMSEGLLVHPDLIPNGWIGLWSPLIYVLFSYGGVEVIGVMANQLKRKTDAPKAGATALLTLTALYIGSLFLILSLVSWRRINEKESPFVTALSSFRLPYIDSVLNLILISAAFSTMVGAMFTITRILVSLANDGDAPKGLTVKNRRGVPLRALGLGAVGLTAGVLLSFLLPNRVYEYLTTAAGVTQILNWVIIFSSQIKLRKMHESDPMKADKRPPFHMPLYPWSALLGIVLILVTVLGGVWQVNQRIGVGVSLAIIAVIFVSSLYLRKRTSPS